MSRQKCIYFNYFWGGRGLGVPLRFSEVSVSFVGREKRGKKVLIWEIKYQRASVIFKYYQKVSEWYNSCRLHIF